jgi:hypothetical protein
MSSRRRHTEPRRDPGCGLVIGDEIPTGEEGGIGEHVIRRYSEDRGEGAVASALDVTAHYSYSLRVFVRARIP